MTIPAERLEQILHRFAEIEARLASGTLEGAEFVAASRDYAELEQVMRVAERVRTMRGELAELEQLDDTDPDIKALAEEEIVRLRGALPEAERALTVAMLPRDSADARPA
ncbi:MAG: PCRF domain-containing protein, partial [Tsuneonella sp.]